jgi:C4-dicarboxylate-specific signal transduction histidine kinase
MVLLVSLWTQIKKSRQGSVLIASDMLDKKIKHIKIFYGLALSLVALTLISSSFLVQRIARDNSSDSRRINIAGRQRMLSQRLVKCVLALHHAPSLSKQNSYLKEIESSLQSWQAAHVGLQQGDERLGLPYQKKSLHLRELFAEVTPYHEAMVGALAFLMKSSRENGVDPAVIGRTAGILLANEPGFLSLMDKITFQLDSEARERVTSLRIVEVVILVIGLSLLLLEFFVVFRPSVIQLASMMDSLKAQSALLQLEVDERRRVELLLQEQQQELESRVAEEVKNNREKDRMLIQSDKMASLGQVAAGVAHESGGIHNR